MKDSADALVAEMRAYAVGILENGEYPKALRWLVAAKELEAFFRDEAILSESVSRTTVK